MEYNVLVPLNMKTPGVVTHVTQVFDLANISGRQIALLRNAAAQGVVRGSRGYVATLLRQLAKHIGVEPLTTVSKAHGNSMQITGTHLLGAPELKAFVSDLMAEGDVRHKLWCAAQPAGVSSYVRDLKSEFSSFRWGGANDHLRLVGFHKPEDVIRRIVPALQDYKPFVDSCAKLAAFIDTKPRIEIHSKDWINGK